MNINRHWPSPPAGITLPRGKIDAPIAEARRDHGRGKSERRGFRRAEARGCARFWVALIEVQPAALLHFGSGAVLAVNERERSSSVIDGPAASRAGRGRPPWSC
jgi:hypothetical protein